MLTVNLFDEAFRHLSCSVHGKTAKRIIYLRDRLRWDGVTLITDDSLTAGLLDRLKSRITIGWLLEPREYKPESYRRAEALLPRLDLLLTHDQFLVDTYPEKCRLVPFGGCWIPETHWGMHPKTQRVVQILSGKEFLPGHRLRHQIMERFPQVECHGWGTPRGRFPFKETVLAPAEFSVVVENVRAQNFFTEKLLDCFAVGTVPIYWGCQNIGDFFDVRGMIQFSDIEGLRHILAEPLVYDEYLGGVKANLERMKPYACTDDWISENILEGL